MVHVPGSLFLDLMTALEYHGIARPVIYTDRRTVNPAAPEKVTITASDIINRYGLGSISDPVMLAWYVVLRSTPPLKSIYARTDYVMPPFIYETTVPNPQSIEIVHTDIRGATSVYFVLTAVQSTEVTVEVAMTLLPRHILGRVLERYTKHLLTEYGLYGEQITSGSGFTT